jgi:ankyrin repeat protein
MSMFKFPHTDFIMAAKAGDVLLLEKLSQDKNNKKDTTLDKALISVSKRDRKKGDQVRVINYLLELGASVECADRKYRCTPLIWTIVAGRDDLVDCLLDNNANIDAYDQYRWWTPLMWAIWYDHQIIVDLLIKRGASLVAVESECYWTPLLLAARYGRYQAARTLLEKEHSLIRVKDRYGLTPLALAYHYGHGECIPLFLEYGDNPNFEFASRQSLLHFAIAAGNITLVKLLLEKGADVECTNSGLPALIAAVKHDNYEITDLLAKHIQKTGGSFEGRDKTKDGLRCTALLWAVRRKNEDLVFLLVARKADLYATDQHGRTVQNWAEWTRNRKIIQIVTWDDGQALSVG